MTEILLNKIIKNSSKTQQRFRSERHSVFTEKINKIALRLNDDKRIQSIDLNERYAYGMSKDVLSQKEEFR